MGIYRLTCFGLQMDRGLGLIGGEDDRDFPRGMRKILKHAVYWYALPTIGVRYDCQNGVLLPLDTLCRLP